MKRHAPDWTSLVAGLTFCGIALAYLGAELAGRSLELRWVAPTLLIGLGIAGLVGTIARARTPHTRTEGASPDDDLGPDNKSDDAPLT